MAPDQTVRGGENDCYIVYGPGISLLRYLNFPAFFEIPEFSGDLHDHQSEELLSMLVFYIPRCRKTIPEFSGKYPVKK
jgi:hypothetical protein